jgi:FAD/FMN-containing dehydrogenase
MNENSLYGPGAQWYARADFVREIPDEAIERNREWNQKMPTFKSGSHVYPVDGAAHDVAPEDTAFAFRDATWSQVFVGVDADPAQAPALKEWTIEALHPFAAGGAYVNFMMDEGQARVKATYAANYARLEKMKAAYDPDNVFRVNQNIAPAA